MLAPMAEATVQRDGDGGRERPMLGGGGRRGFLGGGNVSHYFLLVILLVLLGAMMVYPIVINVAAAFTDNNRFSVFWILNVLGDANFRSQLGTSFAAGGDGDAGMQSDCVSAGDFESAV